MVVVEGREIPGGELGRLAAALDGWPFKPTLRAPADEAWPASVKPPL
ncbi:MAG: hypothetical protein IPP44_25700 [Ideonella sp.]|jgi:hypothetical protein|nr:hypothetical protein [Ideonella sp.]